MPPARKTATDRHLKDALGAALAGLLLTGCASVPTEVGMNGPVTVILDDWRRVARACHVITRDHRAIGCLNRVTTTILCPLNGEQPLAECLAHEIRHLIEPAWTHE